MIKRMHIGKKFFNTAGKEKEEQYAGKTKSYFPTIEEVKEIAGNFLESQYMQYKFGEFSSAFGYIEGTAIIDGFTVKIICDIDIVLIGIDESEYDKLPDECIREFETKFTAEYWKGEDIIGHTKFIRTGKDGENPSYIDKLQVDAEKLAPEGTDEIKLYVTDYQYNWVQYRLYINGSWQKMY